MAVKVFLRDISRAFYRNNPADTFQIEVNYAICMSTGLAPYNDPQTIEGSMLLTFPLTSSPNEVYAQAWTELQNICTENGYEMPTKDDVYLWLPSQLSSILPG